jgi:hypothetical protein
MKSAPETYIEIVVDDAHVVGGKGGAATVGDTIDDVEWSDEPTVRFNFEKTALTPEDRLVIGYLTMEQHGMFGELSLDEALQVVRHLKS